MSKPVLWEQQRHQRFRNMLLEAGRPELENAMARSVKSLSPETANFLVRQDVATCVALTSYFVECPDEALRLCYLSPNEQEAELKRLAETERK